MTRQLLRVGIPLGFIAGYVFLDWVSYIHPLYGLNITPWNPAPALALAYILRVGLSSAIPLFLSILIAEVWVRGLPAPLPITVGVSLLLTAGYTLMGIVLRRRFADSGIFADRRQLLFWSGVIAAGTLITSLAFVSALSFVGIVPLSGWADALIRLWIGEGVGIMVSMPLLWMLTEPHGRRSLRNITLRWETLGYIALMLAAFWVAFGLGAEADFKYFYVLFLPIAWAASRQGLAGAALGAALGQIGIVVVGQLLHFQALTVIEIQMLMLALALMGFFVGLVMDEHRRLSAELRHTLRLAAASEMAGALAHELNQPLTAISAYGAACEQLLAQGESGERLRDVVRHMVSESLRAAEVMRRLRDFFRTGATHLERVVVADLIATAAAQFRERAHQENIMLALPATPNVVILADRMQLEVVLRNLLSNAFDAVIARPDGKRWVLVSAQEESGRRLRIDVEDSGPGISSPDAVRVFEPFHSKKSSGLGLGLAISRAIVEAHGGALWAEATDHGVFKLMLPLN